MAKIYAMGGEGIKSHYFISLENLTGILEPDKWTWTLVEIQPDKRRKIHRTGYAETEKHAFSQACKAFYECMEVDDERN